MGSLASTLATVCPPLRATAYRMAMEYKTTLDKVVGQYDDLNTKYVRMESILMNGGRNGGTPSNPTSKPEGSSQLNCSNGGMNGGTRSNPTSEPEGSSQLNHSCEPDVSSQRQMGHLSSTRPIIRAGAMVSLKSIVNSGHVVAKGIISSIDPKTQIGGADLGRNWCEISIQVHVEWNEELIRSYVFFTTIGDAIGAPIAWPLSLITPLDFDSSQLHPQNTKHGEFHRLVRMND